MDTVTHKVSSLFFCHQLEGIDLMTQDNSTWIGHHPKSLSDTITGKKKTEDNRQGKERKHKSKSEANERQLVFKDRQNQKKLSCTSLISCSLVSLSVPNVHLREGF